MTESLRTSVREAMATVAMECGSFSPDELAEFEKIAAGIKTTKEYQAEILSEIDAINSKKE